eukprot:scaffold79807_cov17-Tisochrysis_lutea.AAC.1
MAAPALLDRRPSAPAAGQTSISGSSSNSSLGGGTSFGAPGLRAMRPMSPLRRASSMPRERVLAWGSTNAANTSSTSSNTPATGISGAAGSAAAAPGGSSITGLGGSAAGGDGNAADTKGSSSSSNSKPVRSAFACPNGWVAPLPPQQEPQQVGPKWGLRGMLKSNSTGAAGAVPADLSPRTNPTHHTPITNTIHGAAACVEAHHQPVPPGYLSHSSAHSLSPRGNTFSRVVPGVPAALPQGHAPAHATPSVAVGVGQRPSYSTLLHGTCHTSHVQPFQTHQQQHYHHLHHLQHAAGNAGTPGMPAAAP